ncbi:HD domain-containing phosphohydrolase [Sulfurimonas sp. HSL3-7]|uniref:HD domain-containing phosphohydrolase n=1 Tax=Sulfonitrofixus jiaomeiensis TaxID=3131938 RepID=UPI0031F9A568
MAFSATENAFYQTAEKITADMFGSDLLAKEMLYQMQNYPALRKPVTEMLPMEIITRFIYTLKRNNNIYAIYKGDSNGDFFEVINMQSSSQLFTHYEAPKETRWMVIGIKGIGEKRTRTFSYLDTSLSLILRRSEPSNFMATSRPWFQQAIVTDKAVRSDPYTFSNLQQKGITYSMRVEDTGIVLALDFTLPKLHMLLKNLKFAESSEIVMFDQEGIEIATSKELVSGQGKRVSEIFLQSEKDKVFAMEEGDEKRFAMVTTMSRENGSNTYLGISVDTDEMLKPYLDNIAYSLLAALLLFVLSIPFVILVTSQIVRPIKALMVENEKIMHRHFDEVITVKTNIIELSQLSDSLVTMSKSINAYQEAQKELMDSFIRLIADAIDAKSPYTGGHCKRVPILATMLVKEAGKADTGTLKAFSFTTKDEMEEFERGAWLHDCGKITTPEYVVDKATKLETIYNRIHEIRTRFEVIWRDIEIAYLEGIIKGDNQEELERWRDEEHQALTDDFRFVAETNIGGEFMSEARKDRIQTIGKRTWLRRFDDRLGLSDTELMRYSEEDTATLPVRENLLGDRSEHIVKRVDFDEEGYEKAGFKLDVPTHLYNYGEIYNLCIEKGTLSEEERFKIQEHVIMSIRMLEQLPYTDDMKRIPEYAGTHHETLIGTGYPRALNADDLSIPARIMAIADIFEALTASDRPYKKGKTLSQALKIMRSMRDDQHIDAELFELFLRSGVYRRYANEHLKKEQIDEVDIELYLN